MTKSGITGRPLVQALRPEAARSEGLETRIAAAAAPATRAGVQE